MTRPFDVVRQVGPASGLYRVCYLANGQTVFVKPLSPERKRARVQLAEYRKMFPGLQEYRLASNGGSLTPRTIESEAVLPPGWKLTSLAEMAAQGVELHEIKFTDDVAHPNSNRLEELMQRIRSEEKVARHARGAPSSVKLSYLQSPVVEPLVVPETDDFNLPPIPGLDDLFVQYDKETGKVRLNGVKRVSLDPFDMRRTANVSAYQLTCGAYEDEIRRMLGLWASELEPVIAFGPCSVPWGLHPAGHATMGVKLKMTVPSIWCPEELRNG